MTHEPANGFLIPCDIRTTAQKGRGVFARDPIRKGTLVWRYRQGAYSVYGEARLMEVFAGMDKDQIIHELTHVFGMAEFPNCLIRIFDDGVLINHDAAPNLRTNNAASPMPKLDEIDARYIDHVTRALLKDRYALVTARDIAAGEELLLNYAEDVQDPPFYHRLCEEYGVAEDYF